MDVAALPSRGTSLQTAPSAPELSPESLPRAALPGDSAQRPAPGLITKCLICLALYLAGLKYSPPETLFTYSKKYFKDSFSLENKIFHFPLNLLFLHFCRTQLRGYVPAGTAKIVL